MFDIIYMRVPSKWAHHTHTHTHTFAHAYVRTKTKSNKSVYAQTHIIPSLFLSLSVCVRVLLLYDARSEFCVLVFKR